MSLLTRRKGWAYAPVSKGEQMAKHTGPSLFPILNQPSDRGSRAWRPRQNTPTMVT